jgi:hypothetical protein
VTYPEAQNVLDMRRAGADMPQAVVDKALELTGDKEAEYSVADAMLEIVLEAKC